MVNTLMVVVMNCTIAVDNEIASTHVYDIKLLSVKQ